MPVTPPDVSTSQIRMSRCAPSAAPLSQGSSAHGMRSVVTLMSRIVMSGLVMSALPVARSCSPDRDVSSCPDLPPSLKLRRARYIRGPVVALAETGSGHPSFFKRMDCRVKPGNDELRLRPLVRPHQIGEAVEQIMRVARAGRGFRVILHREHRLAVERDAAI